MKTDGCLSDLWPLWQCHIVHRQGFLFACWKSRTGAKPAANNADTDGTAHSSGTSGTTGCSTGAASAAGAAGDADSTGGATTDCQPADTPASSATGAAADTAAKPAEPWLLLCICYEMFFLVGSPHTDPSILQWPLS